MILIYLLFSLSSIADSQHVGTCFLSPFAQQLPSPSSLANPANLQPTLNQPVNSLFLSTGHSDAAQVPPNQIPPDNKIEVQLKETKQVKENSDKKTDDFLFPGERSTTPPPTSSQNRDLFPTSRPPAPTKGGPDNTRFVFPGESLTPSLIRQIVPQPQPIIPAIPPSPVNQQKQSFVIRRPSSRGGLKGHSLFLTPEEELINSEELEAISQFEAALEEAKREGLYGLRTRLRPTTTTPPPPPVRTSLVDTYNPRQYVGPLSPPRESVRNLGFYEAGIRDFKETFGFDPLQAGLVTNQRGSGSGIRQPQQLLNNDVAPPPPSLSQILNSRPVNSISAPVTPTPGKFYEWLSRSSFLTNMRIAPGTNFTVLLPTDEALNSIPAHFLSELETNSTKLRETLFYHIIPESIGVEAIASEDMIPTLLRKKDIRVTKGSTNDLLMMSGARVIGERTDLQLDNGKVKFIQIDRVLIPPRGTLYEIISSAPGLSIFKGLVDYTGLKSELEREVNTANGITIFAPTDTAFAQVNHQAASLLTRDPTVARSFLLNHIARPVLFASSIPAGSMYSARNVGSDQELRIERPTRDLVKVNGITVSFADVLATNGVLHVIEHVLL